MACLCFLFVLKAHWLLWLACHGKFWDNAKESTNIGVDSYKIFGFPEGESLKGALDAKLWEKIVISLILLNISVWIIIIDGILQNACL